METKFIDKWDGPTYSEEPQQNQIRWQIYKQVAPGEYHSVSGKFKCKDFFNDFIVAYRAKIKFSKYRFDANFNDVNPDDEEGIPVVLTNLVQNFTHNISIANKWLKGNGFPKLSPEMFDSKSCLMYIPWEYTHNTYYISALSLVIRLCNYGEIKFKESFEEVKNNAKLREKEMKLANTLIHKRMDKLGNTSKYLWWYNKNNHFPSKNMKPDHYSFNSLTHNCGIASWTL